MMATNPNYKMQINLDRRDNDTRKWDTVARFEYGAQAMVAAQALSEADEWEWRIVDNRHEGGPLVIIYKEGVAS
jgi:hypothetical protein